jgi:flagellar motor switch protein FliG
MAQPLERYALVAWVLGRERAVELLSGLGVREAERAKEHLVRIAGLPSAQRQAKVAVEFGERADAAARLKSLMEEVPEPLRREIFRRLPPYHRTLFPGRQVEPVDESQPPALGGLAERLIREATR